MKKIAFALIFGFNTFIFSASVHAQVMANDTLPTIDYSAQKEYEIGGIRVTGAQFTEPNAIIGVTGLQTGKKIKFPGNDVPKAIKALWRLRLFDDVQIIKEKIIGEAIFLEVRIKERPHLTTFSYEGAKKSHHDDLNNIVNRFLKKGSIITESSKENTINGIKKFYHEKGFLDVDIKVEEKKDEKRVNGTKLVFKVDRNGKVKIDDITFEGNANASSRKLRKKMDKTHRKWKIFSSSKLVSEEYEEDKKLIVKYYNSLGFRDAQISKDSVWREKEGGNLRIHMKIDEGRRYYFRNIGWKGNSIYDTKVLSQVFGIQKGDVYNPELMETRLRFSQDGRDVSSLYMDNGYLFFNVEPTELAIDGDSIDMEMRIYEGPQATIDKVVIKGNDRTNEHVIRRELFTLPGQKFSRADIIRSQRAIVGLGYFNQENLGINTPVNPQRGTVDIEYKVEERPSDQLELSAGWGGFGVVGTLGVSFNNFSIRNIFKKEAWSPLPQGDGQRLSIRAQSNGRFFQSYNLSFTEPWLGGKKPTSLSVAGAYQNIDYGEGQPQYSILNGSVSLGRRLRWPDNYFISSTALEYQRFNILSGRGAGSLLGFDADAGIYNILAISQTFSRNSVTEQIFPKDGSQISLNVKASLPYSLFNQKRYADLTDSEKYKWAEFYKWRFNAAWYTPLVGKLVLKTEAKIGSLGYYNRNIGYIPFERYTVGGDGIANRQFAAIGIEQLALRGYDLTDLQANEGGTGGTTFVKYTAEVRYPISLNPSSTIYIHAFAQGGNIWSKLSDFRPFDVRRSVGMGLRVFLPMFGTLGFDYGIGLDKPNASTRKWTDLARFAIILGFEPD